MKEIKSENIPGYPGYFVSRDGKVYSNKSGDWKLKRISLSNTNRFRVRLRGKLKYKWIQVNRLVAMVYIPNPNNHPIVMHLDNNPHNNRVENLKWGTQSENIQQAYNENRAVAPQCLRSRGENHPGSKISNKIRYTIVRLYYKGILCKDLAKKFSLSKRHITKIIHDYNEGIRW